jgi:hypothetical protein
LSSPNVSIGDMVFQAVRTRFPLRIAAGMTELGLLQEPPSIHKFGNVFIQDLVLSEQLFQFAA